MPEPIEGTRSRDIRLVGGLAWTAGAKWATQLITWGSLLLVARLLSLSDYGVGEMAGTLLILSNVLAEFGVGTAVLHMPELSRKTLAQLHLFSCLLCTGVFLVACLLSPLIAAFYKSSHVNFFVANNLALFLTGFEAVPMGLLARDMDYRRLSLAEAAMVVIQAVVTVVLAWMGFGYWALFGGAMAGKTTATILVCSWKHVGFAWPRWKDIKAPVELGRHVAVSRVAWSIYNQADGIIVGRVLGPSVLGVYRMAMNLASAPAEKLSTLLMRTATPLFANIQNDRALVRRYYLILTETLSLVVIPLMLGLAAVAPQAVPVILGQKWAGAIAPIRWLAVFMILRSMGTLSEQVLISQRLTRFTMRMSILNFFVMPTAFWAAAHGQGTNGVAAAWVVLTPITILPTIVLLLRHIELPYRQFAAAILPSIAGAATMILVLRSIDSWIGVLAWPPQVRLAIEIIGGGAVYAGVVFGFFRRRVLRYVDFLRGLQNKREPESAILCSTPGAGE